MCFSDTLKHMGNITLTMDSELIRQARILAAQRNTSVSTLVAQLLQSTCGQCIDDEQVWEQEEAAMNAGLLQVGAITWTRDEVHTR